MASNSSNFTESSEALLQTSNSDHSTNSMITIEDEGVTLLTSPPAPSIQYAPHLNACGDEEDFLSSSRLKRFSNMILYSRQYLIFYSLVMILQLSLFFYAAIKTRWFRDTLMHMPLWYVILDVVVIGLMCLELLLRITAAGKRFFRKMTNLCDIILVSFCVLTLPLYFVHHTTIYFSLALTIARYTSQIVRLTLMIRLQVKRAKMADIANTTVSLHYDTFLPHGDEPASPNIPVGGASYASTVNFNAHASLDTDSDSEEFVHMGTTGGGSSYDVYDKRIARGIAALSASYRSASSHVPQASGAEDGKESSQVPIGTTPVPVLIAGAPLTPRQSLYAHAGFSS